MSLTMTLPIHTPVLVEEAIEDLSIFNQVADPLRAIARYIIERKK